MTKDSIPVSEPVEKNNSIMKDTKTKDDSWLANLTFAKADAANNKKNENIIRKEALKLTRCIITCNNPNKVSYQGEIFCARNKIVDAVKKFIPFGVKTHVPQILLNMIKEKKLQMFKKEKVNGNMITRTYLIPEYNIQELPPISPEEFESIKRKQLAEGSVE